MLKKIYKKIKKDGIFTFCLFVIITISYRFFRIFYNIFLNHLKVKKNYIIFSSMPDYSDNAKALYLYMLKKRNKHNYTYIWLVNENKKYNSNKNTIFINKKSKYHQGPTLKALYYTAISKEIYYTHSSPIDKFKPEQKIINLWHGCGYKDKEITKKSYIETNYFDYVLVPGKIFIESKSKFFRCSKEKILDIGYPRYDLLINEDFKTQRFINKLTNNNKLIVWMPTFRKTINNQYPEEIINRIYDLPILNSDEDLMELDKICNKNNIMIYIKRHPMQIKYSCEKIKLSNIHFIDQEFLQKNDIDLYQFLHYTDSLITDYSSIAIDYLLLNKPIAFSLDDFDDYSNTRGFIFKDPKKYMPGHHLYNFDDLKKYLLDIAQNKDIYIESRKSVINEVHNKCKNYCKRIFDTINKMEDN